MKKFIYEVKKCLGCRSCEIACAVIHSGTGELFSALKEEMVSLPRKKVFVFSGKNYPLSCQHCEDAKCVIACMAGALTVDKKQGLVLHDESRCVGCWMCVMACPYGAIRPNVKTKKPVRCDKCREKDEPACVKACPTKAIKTEEGK